MFEMLVLLAKRSLADDTCLQKFAQAAINRGPGNFGLFAAAYFYNLLCGKMSMSGHDGRKNCLPAVAV